MARRFLTRFRSWTSTTSSKSTGEPDSTESLPASPGADAAVASSQASRSSVLSTRSRRDSLRPNWGSQRQKLQPQPQPQPLRKGQETENVWGSQAQAQQQPHLKIQTQIQTQAQAQAQAQALTRSRPHSQPQPSPGSHYHGAVSSPLPSPVPLPASSGSGWLPTIGGTLETVVSIIPTTAASATTCHRSHDLVDQAGVDTGRNEASQSLKTLSPRPQKIGGKNVDSTGLPDSKPEPEPNYTSTIYSDDVRSPTSLSPNSAEAVTPAAGTASTISTITAPAGSSTTNKSQELSFSPASSSSSTSAAPAPASALLPLPNSPSAPIYSHVIANLPVDAKASPPSLPPAPSQDPAHIHRELLAPLTAKKRLHYTTPPASVQPSVPTVQRQNILHQHSYLASSSSSQGVAVASESATASASLQPSAESGGSYHSHYKNNNHRQGQDQDYDTRHNDNYPPLQPHISLSSVMHPPHSHHPTYQTMGPSHAVHKVWVKKAESTATQVVVGEDDLVDSVRDVILRKFANSLGRHFDSADITLCLQERKTNKMRKLGPEEPLWDVIQAAYPNGQLVNEALVIGDISNRMNKASPRYVQQPNENSEGYFPPAHSGPIISPGSLSVHGASPNGSTSRRWSKPRDDQRIRRHIQTGLPPANNLSQQAAEAVPPMPPAALPPTQALDSISAAAAATATPTPTRLRSSISKSAVTPPASHPSMAATAVIPDMSAGSTATALGSIPSLANPPAIITTTAHSTSAGTSPPSTSSDSADANASTTSATAVGNSGTNTMDSGASKIPIAKSNLKAKSDSLADSQTSENGVGGNLAKNLVGAKPIAESSAPVNEPDSDSKIISPANQSARRVGSKRDRADPAQAVPPPNHSIPLSIPPIRVLIVEDNPINMRLIHTFLSRLNVRREKATTGEEAVQKWRKGGYHLILMDIQLPIMNGLEATQEIRRLERINKITKHGIDFGGGNHKLTEEPRDPGDILENPEMHKGQVIIVALTASSLPSDRRRALAAGCNDFLTKPVNLPYLQKKILEWGCMQALIDFDNWANWKNMAIVEEERERVSSEKARAAPKPRKKKKELAPSAD
ncbi:Two-component response regulator SSK1p [Ceratocystis pirilliformis]|uniref:Two-component response regulator SSK1p n=1 Tax=Ceratocystis pirilliformis TaxID=259994 RepID=A0ABR3Z6L4_9PEZI